MSKSSDFCMKVRFYNYIGNFMVNAFANASQWLCYVA